MPLPYSADRRERVLLAPEQGEGHAAVLSRRFRVAFNTVKKGVRAAETEGGQTAGPRPGAAIGGSGAGGPVPAGGRGQGRHSGRIGRPSFGADRGPGQPVGAGCHPHAPGLGAPQKTLRASAQRRADLLAERAAFAAAIAPETLVFLDASGISTTLTRLCARAGRGSEPGAPRPVIGSLFRGSARSPWAVWSPS
jgi:hypothetical protein